MQQQTQHDATETETQSTPDTSFNVSGRLDGSSGISTDSNLNHVPNTKRAAVLARVTQYRKQAKMRYGVNLFYGLVMMSFLLVYGMLMPAGTSVFMPLLIFGCVFCSLVMYAITWSQMRAIEKTIAAIDDIQMIGPLAEAWDAERFLKPKAIISALCRLLPRLQASDTNLLTRQQRACLYNAINWKAGRAVYQYDRRLTVAILKALQQIGDKEALPYVKRAAWSSHKEVRDAANDCMRFLLEQAEDHKRGAQLLRPADARTSSSDVLLRACTEMTPQQQTPPEQLLRAHNQE